MSLPFILHLSCPEPDQARVEVVRPPDGEWTYTVAHPFSRATLRVLLQLLEKRDLDRSQFEEYEPTLAALDVIENRRLVGPDERTLRIGRYLYQGLFPDVDGCDAEVRAVLEAALEEARHTRKPVPLQLCFELNAVDLARIPWELLCRGDDPLVLRERLHLARYITFKRSTVPFPIANRLEVLVVTARPADTPRLDPDAEREAIKKAFEFAQAEDRIHVDFLDPPTLDKLREQIRSHLYHVVHFDGHGMFGRRCSFCQEFITFDVPFCTNLKCRARLHSVEPEGCLLFETKEGQPDPVTASDLITTLSMSHVRLFVASACKSATVGGSSALNGLAPHLIQEVPAVVGMQFSIPEDSAKAFVKQFYGTLAKGGSIAAAVADGRRALFESETWYIPTVYLRSADGEGNLFRFQDMAGVRDRIIGGDARGTRIYLLPAGKDPPDWAEIRDPSAAPYKYLSPFETTDKAVFYGREAETQNLVGELLHRHLQVLYGPPGVGKTSLVNAGLVPELLKHGYLVLSLRQYDDPVGTLCHAVSISTALDVNLTGVNSLHELVDALQRDVGRPLVIVFDEFDGFLHAGDERDAKRRSALVQDMRTCIHETYPLPFCLLLVVQEGSLGRLSALEPTLPNVLEHGFLLAPLTREQAKLAIEKPLLCHDPSIGYNEKFLEDILLPALSAGGEAGRINPMHLQIVCREMFKAALDHKVRDDKVPEIGPREYPSEGAGDILKGYLRRRLVEHFPERATRDRIRRVLKQMVSPAGERVFVSAVEAAQKARTDPGEIQEALDLLQGDALIEAHYPLDGVPTYSLSHPMLADEVHRWFDPEEAKDRGAAEVLRRAWDDWHEKVYRAREQAGDDHADAGEFLIGPARLREIRERRQGLEIKAERFCLLLRSAVFHRCDMAYWAHEVAKDEGAQQLLMQIHQGLDGDAPDAAKSAASLGAAALGIGSRNAGEQALARAAVGRHPGSVRHTAALAMGAAWQAALDPARSSKAGMTEEEVRKALEALAVAPGPGRGWRRVQALAQMKAAGLRLPRIPDFLQFQVDLWHTGIRLAEARWRLVAQAIGAGLGGGFGLLIPAALVYISAGLYGSPEIASYLLVGWVVGMGFAAGRWLLDTLVAGRVWRVVGASLGFGLGLVALWPFTPHLSGWQLATGLLAGAAVALGGELLAHLGDGDRERTPVVWWAGLGGGLGGALIFAVTVLSVMRLPFVLKSDFVAKVVESPWVAALSVVIAAITGAMVGFGLTGGSAAGEVLWRRLSVKDASPDWGAEIR